jgi:hypothetical protein
MPKWYIGNELVAYGRKLADYDPPAFRGIYTCYVLVISDEAGSVPKSIFDAVDALATKIDARVVAVGNPDDPTSHFTRSASQALAGTWRRSAHSTPRRTPLRRSPVDLLPLLVSPGSVEERKLRWDVDRTAGNTSRLWSRRWACSFKKRSIAAAFPALVDWPPLAAQPAVAAAGA